MASKRRLSSSPSPDGTPTDPNETKQDDSSKGNLCLICGDNARFINYGALSCQSCKTFFRRNGYRPESVRPCIYNKNCEINMLTRHSCTTCRVAKCFAMGMTKDLIRKQDHKKAKTLSLSLSSSSTTSKTDNIEQVSSTQLTTTSQVMISGPNRDNQFCLLDSDWILISNILRAYDTYSVVGQICQTIDSLSRLSVETTHLNAISLSEIISQMFLSIQSLISCLPDFQILTLDEQTSLFERNLQNIIGFYAILFFRDTAILHNIKCNELFTNLYGSDIISLVKKVGEHLDPDATLIKLILIIFVFSSNCFIVNKNQCSKHDSLLYGTFRLLGSQNVYVDLLWKYMIYRYGYYKAVVRFSRLIQIFLCLSKHLAMIYENNHIHQNMVDGIIEKIKQSLTINENEQIPLWGKN